MARSELAQLELQARLLRGGGGRAVGLLRLVQVGGPAAVASMKEGNFWMRLRRTARLTVPLLSFRALESFARSSEEGGLPLLLFLE